MITVHPETMIIECIYIYVQAVKVADQAVIDEWIEYLKVHPEDEWGDKIIDECDWDSGLNAVHVAVIRNKVQILRKLVDTGAGMDIRTIIHTLRYLVPIYVSIYIVTV